MEGYCMCVNQILELSIVMDKDEFRKVLMSNHNVEIHEESDEEYIDQSLESDGIIVIYRDSQYKKKVKVIANTRLLLGNDKIDSDKLIRKLDKCISKYFSFRYQTGDFKLSGVIFTVDIDVQKQNNVSSYLKVLKRIGKVKGFSPLYYDCFEENTSFCLDGNSNGIQFLIYDLENLLKNQLGKTVIGRKKLKSIADETKGILRAEVRLMKPRAIRNYTDETDITGQIVELSKNCKGIFMDTFTRIIPFGDYFKKDKAVEIIQCNVKDSIMRRKMLHLLALIPEKKSLYLAQKSMNCRNIEKVMEAFAKINVSLVTISKRQDVKHLNSIYTYLLDE